MKKIDEKQVQELYHFTRQHYVEYYDVQTELVDHLANGIEEQWKEDPKMPFEQALHKEFKKFGVSGFEDVVRKKSSAMEKKYFRIIFAELKKELQKPAIAVLLAGFFLLSLLLLQFRQGFYFLLGSMLVYFLFFIIHFAIKSSAVKRRKRREKKYLLESIILNAGSYFTLFWMPLHILYFNFEYGTFQHIGPQVLLSVFISFLGVLTYICYYHVPRKTSEILKKAQPLGKFTSQ